MQSDIDTPGLHHVTAIAGDPETNAAFYTGTLGLRFVKRTVNHDDTSTYHFYYGDGAGSPGTNLTFFTWTERGRPGRFGAGQTRTTAYLVPPGTLEYWADRLDAEGVDYETDERFGEPVLGFTDPDGIGLELVASADATEGEGWTAWEGSPVPPNRQLRGFHSVTLAVTDREPTASVLELLGYEREREADGRYRYRTTAGGPGSVVDLVETDRGRGTMGVGTVHHVAFKAEDETHERTLREALRDHGLHVTDVIDRAYFRSVYAREPGGVLFEIATMGPGFTADEPLEDLGTRLALPDWLEDDRERIEARLPAFEPPAPADSA